MMTNLSWRATAIGGLVLFHSPSNIQDERIESATNLTGMYMVQPCIDRINLAECTLDGLG